MPRSIVTGLDIGTAAIRLVACEITKDQHAPPRLLAQVKKDSRGLRRGYIVNFDETITNLKETIREAERQAKIRIKSVCLGIGGVGLESVVADGQVAVSKADLEIAENDINRVVEISEANLNLANRRLLHTIPLAFKLDGKKILGRPEGMKGGKLEAKTLFISCLTQHLNDLIRAVESAGLAVDEVIAAPVAASIPTLTTTQKTAGCVLINIGSQTTSLLVFEDNLPFTLQVLPLGANDVTNDIALGLRISIEEAEKIKLDNTRALNLKKKLDEIIEARLSDIFELIEAQLKKIGRSGLLPAGAIIIGGGALISNVERLARQQLRLPAKIFDPLAMPAKAHIKDAGWVVAYGLCLSGLGLGAGESAGSRFLRQTRVNFLRWLKEFLP